MDAGRIDTVKPVGQIIDETVNECEAVLREVGKRYAP